MRRIYTLLLYLAAPAVLLRLLWRSRRNPAYRQCIGERFGVSLHFPARPRVWVHAVSVGEVIASAPLLRRLLSDYPQHALLVTTTTPTGREQLMRMFGERVEHVYLPYDLPGAVERFLRRAQPRIFLCMETEIWPNLFAACERRNIPIILANARMSARSARAYVKVASFTRQTLRRVSAVAARDARDAERFRVLGARRVFVAGNLKHDLDVPATARETGMTLRAAFGANRPVWIAASTHHGEDTIVLDAHRRLKEHLPDAALILVPRHPERFDDVAEQCVRAGFSICRRSTAALPAKSADVFLGDTVGELMSFYAAADVAFIGGSLMDIGGHNPLEAVALGLPVLTGPQTYNFEQIYIDLFNSGAAKKIGNAQALASELKGLLLSSERRSAMGRQGESMLLRHRGATRHLLALIADSMP